jgi:hypothetical protein
MTVEWLETKTLMWSDANAGAAKATQPTAARASFFIAFPI